MEAARKWFEVGFDLTYLTTVWGFVGAMFQRRDLVRPEDRRVAKLVLVAFLLLALGDTGHVGFRVLAYALGSAPQLSLWGAPLSLTGLGTLMTAVTMTLFYVLFLAIWRYRFQGEYGAFGHLLMAAALLRLILLAMPVNQWNAPVPPQPWSTIRNLPLLLQGLGVACLLLRDAARQGDRAFWWMALMILVSYTCYAAVVLLVQRYPAVGFLMIPKTVAYLVICVLAYKALYQAQGTLAED